MPSQRTGAVKHARKRRRTAAMTRGWVDVRAASKDSGADDQRPRPAVSPGSQP